VVTIAAKLAVTALEWLHARLSMFVSPLERRQ
jgi:hypothetical protein